MYRLQKCNTHFLISLEFSIAAPFNFKVVLNHWLAPFLSFLLMPSPGSSMSLHLDSILLSVPTLLLSVQNVPTLLLSENCVHTARQSVAVLQCGNVCKVQTAANSVQPPCKVSAHQLLSKRNITNGDSPCLAFKNLKPVY